MLTKKIKIGISVALPALIVLMMLLTMINFSSINCSAYTNNEITNDDFVKVSGSKLINAKGEEVVLKGTNVGGWLLQENWMCPISGSDREWANLDTIEAFEDQGFTQTQIQTLFNTYQDNWITESDLDFIAQTGCNVIRVPFWYRNFMLNTDGDWIDSDFDNNPGFNKLDWIIQEAGERGMYIILDMHGCPGGQSMDHCCGTLAQNDLYTNTTYQNTLVKLWKAIARRYKNNPVVAAYDAMNEPQNNGGYSGAHSYDPWVSSTWDKTNDMYDIIVDAIRSVDTNHVITVEGIWRITNLPDPSDYGWTNMMYQVHMYDDTSTFTTLLNDAIDLCEEYGVALYVGEFSNMDGVNLCASNNVNYTTWTYKAGQSVGNWAWVSKSCSLVNPETDSYKTILRKWGTAIKTSNNFTKNDYVINKVKDGNNIIQLPVRYESENAVINYGNIGQNGNFSNGSFVGNMNTVKVIKTKSQILKNWSNIPYAKHTVNVDKAGYYKIKIAYATTTNKVLTYIRANYNSPSLWQKVTYPSTGQWNKVKTKEITIKLNKGNNTLWLSGSVRGVKTNNWINYDYIEVSFDH